MNTLNQILRGVELYNTENERMYKFIRAWMNVNGLYVRDEKEYEVNYNYSDFDKEHYQFLKRIGKYVSFYTKTEFLDKFFPNLRYSVELVDRRDFDKLIYNIEQMTFIGMRLMNMHTVYKSYLLFKFDDEDEPYVVEINAVSLLKNRIFTDKSFSERVRSGWKVNPVNPKRIIAYENEIINQPKQIKYFKMYWLAMALSEDKFSEQTGINKEETKQLLNGGIEAGELPAIKFNSLANALGVSATTLIEEIK